MNTNNVDNASKLCVEIDSLINITYNIKKLGITESECNTLFNILLLAKGKAVRHTTALIEERANRNTQARAEVKKVNKSTNISPPQRGSWTV
jgi:hypothetical protein